MAFFKMFKKKGREAAMEMKKFEKRDLMEGVVGACLLVAFADGELEKDEIESMEKQLAANPCLEGFGAEIGKTMNKFQAMLEAGWLIGKTKILREIKDCASDKEESEDIFVAAITIAQADGEVEPEEVKILGEIGRALGLSLRDYGLE